MMRINACELIVIAIAGLSAGIASAQTGRPQVGDPAGANLPAQKLGPNDLISISVYDDPGLSRTARVSDDGFIRMPMLKKRIPVQGLLPAEVEIAIADELKAEQIMVDPIVSVTVSEYASRPISVVGAVHAPVTFQAMGPVNLLEAIARAGGLSPQAGSEVLVTRTAQSQAPGGASLVQRIPVRGLINDADPQWNIPLHGGEEIRVPEMSKLYVMGNVKKPGAFPLQEGGVTTLLQMLALSEGLLPYTSKEAFVYRREGQLGANEMKIPLRKILNRESPDVPLMANDIVYIPDSRARRATYSALERILSFAAGTISGVIIYSGIR